MSELKSNDKSLFDRLYDENDTDPIVLVGEDGKKISFEQVAIIPYGECDYCILAPTDENQIDGAEDDDVIIFRIATDSEEQYITVEEDEAVANAVFNEFLKLIDEE